MRKLGMLGLTARDKFIPAVYENGSVATRVSLLQGLFDTDGHASGGGSVECTTVSDQIAHAVQRIVFSLGGTCKLVKRQTRYTKDGEHSRWFDSFRLHIKLPADICPFRFSRKRAEFYRDGWQRKVGRAVESVTAIGKGLATCIAVDAPDHLYLTRNCVPTHNTILAVELARRLGRATIVVVHKEFFLEQWAARIRDVLPDARIGVVRQDTCDYRDKDFVIAMIQSLAKDVQTQRYPRALYEAFGTAVYDEVHHTGADAWSAVAHRFTAAYRIGLSATPKRADRAEAVFFHHLGPILHTMQAQSMPFGVRLLQSDSELTGIRRGDYRVSAVRMNSAQVISQLGEDAARTRHIAEDIAIAVRKGRKVMVVSHRLEHLRALRADLRKILGVAPPPFPVAIAPYTGQWFTGEEGEAKRTVTRAELREAERANVLLCTIQLVSEGLDVSALDVIVLATPLGDAEQAIGRVRRWCTPSPEKCAHYCPWRAGQCPGKPTPVVVDVRDPKVAWSQRKARGRDKLYRRMGVALPGEEAQGGLPVDKPRVIG